MKKINWYLVFLFLIFAIFWTWATINPIYQEDWLLENYLVFIFVPIIIITGYYFRLSNTSYTLITIFMVLHIIGSHYTYSEVPFGFVLQDIFNSNRNLYDRLVHLSFGLLFAYPIREVFVRITGAKGVWGFYFPTELILALSAIFEFLEWFVVEITSPQAGLAFLGAQGDVWDTQKDMLLAFIGSIVAMIFVLILNLIFNKETKREIKESIRIPKTDKPMGEVKIKSWIKNIKDKEHRKLYKTSSPK